MNVVVIGGSSGIGAATVQLLVSRGHNVVMTSRSADGEWEETVQGPGPSGSTSLVSMDVTKEETVVNGYAAAIEKLGSLDGVVVCAGVTFRAPIRELESDRWDEVCDVNLRGTFLACKHALPHLSRGASIVNIASVAAFKSLPGRAAYAASKSGVVALTRQIAYEEAPNGIRCNVVCPAGVETPMLHEAFRRQGLSVEVGLEASAKMHPLGRLAEPKEVASAISYLLSDEAAFVTGTSFVLDGGVLA